MSDLHAVINRHVGRPWSAHGFDCWAFLRAVYDESFGILLPVLPGLEGEAGDHRAAARAAAEAQASGDWLLADAPRNGDAILMGKRDRPHHCGVWLDGGIVAHCDQVSGVRCESMRHLATLGWGSFTYHQHRLRP